MEIKNNTNPDRNDEVILELDRPRSLRLGHKALKRFSAVTNSSMADLEQEIQHYEKLALLAYIMLSEDDSALTPEQVDDLLDKKPVKAILTACSNAIKAAFEDEDAEPLSEDDNPQMAAGTGTEA